MTTSAEQLAIALMAQACTLYLIDSKDGVVFPAQLGDRLAEWSSQVRQLGVELYEARAGFSAAKEAEVTAKGTLDDLRRKLRSVRNSSDPVLWADTLEAMAVMLDV